MSQTLDLIDGMLRFFEREEKYVTPAISSSGKHNTPSDNIRLSIRSIRSDRSVLNSYNIIPRVVRGRECLLDIPFVESIREVSQEEPFSRWINMTSAFPQVFSQQRPDALPSMLLNHREHFWLQVELFQNYDL